MRFSSPARATQFRPTALRRQTQHIGQVSRKVLGPGDDRLLQHPICRRHHRLSLPLLDMLLRKSVGLFSPVTAAPSWLSCKRNVWNLEHVLLLRCPGPCGPELRQAPPWLAPRGFSSCHSPAHSAAPTLFSLLQVFDATATVVPDYRELKEVAIFLTQPNVLPPDVGLALYVSIGGADWSYRGGWRGGGRCDGRGRKLSSVELQPTHLCTAEGCGLCCSPCQLSGQLGESGERLSSWLLSPLRRRVCEQRAPVGRAAAELARAAGPAACAAGSRVCAGALGCRPWHATCTCPPFTALCKGVASSQLAVLWMLPACWLHVPWLLL